MKQVLKEKSHKQEKVNPFLSQKLTSVAMLEMLLIVQITYIEAPKIFIQ